MNRRKSGLQPFGDKIKKYNMRISINRVLGCGVCHDVAVNAVIDPNIPGAQVKTLEGWNNAGGALGVIELPPNPTMSTVGAI